MRPDNNALTPLAKTEHNALLGAFDYKAAIDKALVVRHLGVADGKPESELNQIIDWEVAVARDPALTGDVLIPVNLLADFLCLDKTCTVQEQYDKFTAAASKIHALYNQACNPAQS